MKVRQATDGVWMAKCPACGNCHGFDSRWTFNGNVDNPTFSPSMLVKVKGNICHSFLTDGHWVYLSDCTHELKGQKVEVPEW